MQDPIEEGFDDLEKLLKETNSAANLESNINDDDFMEQLSQAVGDNSNSSSKSLKNPNTTETPLNGDTKSDQKGSCHNGNHHEMNGFGLAKGADEKTEDKEQPKNHSLDIESELEKSLLNEDIESEQDKKDELMEDEITLITDDEDEEPSDIGPVKEPPLPLPKKESVEPKESKQPEPDEGKKLESDEEMEVDETPKEPPKETVDNKIVDDQSDNAVADVTDLDSAKSKEDVVKSSNDDEDLLVEFTPSQKPQSERDENENLEEDEENEIDDADSGSNDDPEELKISESNEASNIETATEDSNQDREQDDQMHDAEESVDIEMGEVNMGEIEPVELESSKKLEALEDNTSRHSNQIVISEDNSRSSLHEAKESPSNEEPQSTSTAPKDGVEKISDGIVIDENETSQQSTNNTSISKKKRLEIDSDDSSHSSKKMKIDETSKETQPEIVIEKENGKPTGSEEKIIEKAPELKPELLKFLRKFKKPHDTLTRSDLEELIAQKVLERVIYKSDLGEIIAKMESHEKMLTHVQKKSSELTKQYADMEMIHNRVIKDLELRNEGIVTPVKITRAVGLQVYQPFKQKPPPTPEKPPTPLLHQTVPKPPASQQNAFKPPAVEVNNKTAPTQVSLLNHQNLNAMARKPATIQQQQQQVASMNTASGSVASTEGPKRRGPKITPMRPNMSENEQAQIKLQTHKDQQQWLQNFKTQINLPAKPTQGGITFTNNLMQPQMPQQQKIHNYTAQILLQQQQPSTANTYQPQNPNQKTIFVQESSATGRMMLKKVNVKTPNMINQQTIPTQGQKSGIPVNIQHHQMTVPVQQSSGHNKFVGQIDLTDEEDNSHSRKNGPEQINPPALVAIPSQNAQNIQKRTSSGQQGTVTYIVKPNSGSNNSQLASTINRLQQMRKVSSVRPNTGPENPNPQIIVKRHPAPLPPTPVPNLAPGLRKIPPRPVIKINNIQSGIVVSWSLDQLTEEHAEIQNYQIYAYQETNSIPATENWRHVGDVKALLLPMAVTLTQFQEGQKYFFAVRGVDTHGRIGPFSQPKTWSEKN